MKVIKVKSCWKCPKAVHNPMRLIEHWCGMPGGPKDLGSDEDMECIHKNCPLSDDPTAKLVEALSECVSRFKWLKIYGSLSHAADWKKCERTMGKAKAVLAEVKDV